MAPEIWAGIIQAIPVGVAALVGWRGLDTWRMQLREGRQVEHAEQALASAAPMFSAIRLARYRWSTLTSDLAADSAEMEAALKHEREERLTQAFHAWNRFQERYELAGLYIPEPKRQLDVAREVGGCLSDLSRHARMMWEFREIDERELATKERMAFYPNLLQPDDPIEVRLKAAERALQAELRPILLPEVRRLAGIGGIFSGLIPRYMQPP